MLLQRYLPALRTHLLLTRHLPLDQVEDFLQDFATDQIVQENLVAHADRRRGKFRSFLLLALNRHVISQLRRERARKRGPNGATLVSLNEKALNKPEQDPTCEHFDRAWAKELVHETLRRLRIECDGCGRDDIWDVFEGRMLGPLLHNAKPQAYKELARVHGLATPQAAANLLTTGKRMFARLLRSVVNEYVADEKQIDAEIAELMLKLEPVHS